MNISTLLSNPQAHEENKRFIDEDLNRQFSHKVLHEGNHLNTAESARAKELDALLGPKFADVPATDVIIDLHSTTTNMGLTLIIAEGDKLMAAAAAYVLQKCGGEKAGARCLIHKFPSLESRPNLASVSKHGLSIEVGPVPQGVLRHDAIERTQKAMHALLEFLERRNQPDQLNELEAELSNEFIGRKVPCFRSAPAVRPGEMSGKIPWPTDEANPNFPAWVLHKSVQDKDFGLIRTGDPLFIDIDGNVVPYSGSHGSPVHLMFLNEGGYYYASSGTGIGVAQRSHFDFMTGQIVEEGVSHKTEEL